jgi:hypothetical protein
MQTVLKLFMWLVAMANVGTALIIDAKLQRAKEMVPPPPGIPEFMLWLEHVTLVLVGLWAISTFVILLHNKLTTGIWTWAPLPSPESTERNTE